MEKEKFNFERAITWVVILIVCRNIVESMRKTGGERPTEQGRLLTVVDRAVAVLEYARLP